MSLPNGVIFVPPKTALPDSTNVSSDVLPAGSDQYPGARRNGKEYCAVFVHEVFHQYQYRIDGEVETFKRFIQEMWDNMRGYDLINPILDRIDNTHSGRTEPLADRSVYPTHPSRQHQGAQGGYCSYNYENFIGRPMGAPLLDYKNDIVEHLQKISVLEGQAQFLEEFTLDYLSNESLTRFRRALYTNNGKSGIFTSVR
jgi:hypothetical protein